MKDENGPAISAITVVYTGKGESVPPGYTILASTPTGKQANLVPTSRGVFIAVKRQESGPDAGYSMEPAIQVIT